ncbi:hypothetical protein [Acidithiobacillus acidisediminis]|uniref:hypothetical protein n=1 Tax=Acidithiobacillus acidisediminis TaxID=2937799 RepID=UPI0020108AAC|nr:hypothetical protein [Acidithiobacillus sp. S30A2]
MRIAGTPNEQLNQFLDALRKEGDRGAALAAAAFAEEILDEILLSFLADVPESKELTKGFAAPIGTFGSKIKLAYVLGLLDKELLNGINISRRIRNEFAHQWTPVSFETENVQNLVASLSRHSILNSLPEPRNTRERFEAYVSALLLELSFIPGLVEREKRIPTRIVRFGKLHNTKEEADAEHEEYKRTGVPPWTS